MDSFSKRLFLLAIILAIIFVLPGCIDWDEKVTFHLNPDGSGKVDVTIVCASNNLNDEEPNPENFLFNVLEDSNGIEAWKNLKCEKTEDNKIRLSGTAYFRNISELEYGISSSGMDLDYTVTADNSGNMILKAQREKDEADTPEQNTELTGEELEEKIQEAKAEYARTKPFLATLLPMLQYSAKFHINGNILETVNFTREEDGTLGIELDGAKMFEAIEELASDDEWWKRSVLAGEGIGGKGPNELDIFEKMYGTRAIPKAIIKPGAKPVFDYEKEVAEARKETEALKKKLGIGTIVELEMGDENSIAVTVAKVSLTRIENKKLDMKREYTITLLCRLPREAMKIVKCETEKIITDTGSSMKKKTEWFVINGEPKLAEDNRTFQFDIRLGVPEPDVKGFREISGTVEYLLSGDLVEKDLGFTKLEEGAQGTMIGARIISVRQDSLDKEETELTLMLAINAASIKKVTFQDGSGSDINVQECGSTSSRSRTELTFKIQGSFPEDGKILLEFYEGTKRIKTPFSIKNIDLVGNPMK
ncbi:MAG: hypothetical protein ACYS8W_03715 [Planctomycetota bacterium]|jgi:hypothetical protein